MSYDIRVRAQQKEFRGYLLSKGYKEVSDTRVDIIHEKPLLYLTYENDLLYFNYLRSHYHVNFAYWLVIKALGAIPGFEVEDPQTGKLFSAGNIGEVTPEYISTVGRIYTDAGFNTMKAVFTAGDTPLSSHDGRVPVPFSVLDRISDDIFNKESYSNATFEGKEYYFPSPFLLVSTERKKYKVMYAWTNFMDIVFPYEFVPDLIRVGWVGEDTNNEYRLDGVYTYKDIVKAVGEPEMETFDVIGRRRVYRGLEGRYQKILSTLKSTFTDRGAYIENMLAIDENLDSVYTVPDPVKNASQSC